MIDIKQAIKDYYDTHIVRVMAIKQVLEEQFGEENVDIETLSHTSFEEYTEGYISDKQLIPTTDEELLGIIENCWNFMIASGNKCVIRFPEITVTNEEDKSVKIQDVYVKFFFTFSGIFLDDCFTVTRSTFDVYQWRVGYMHSHVHSMYTTSLPVFKTPCLGNGPIKDTIETLKGEYNIDLWGLFSYELLKYLETESLVGVPYVRMSSIKSGSVDYKDMGGAGYMDTKTMDMIINETDDISIGFDKVYYVSDDIYSFALKVSKATWKIYMELVKKYSVITPFVECWNVGGKLCGKDNASVPRFNGDKMFMFKGSPVRLNVYVPDDDNMYEDNSIPVLGYRAAARIRKRMNKLLNIGNLNIMNHDGIKGEKRIKVL